MLLPVRLGALLVPVDDRLVGDTVRVVQHFDDGGESLHDSRVGVAVDLDRVDEVHFGFGAVTEWLEDRRVGLGSAFVTRATGTTHRDMLNDRPVKLV